MKPKIIFLGVEFFIAHVALSYITILIYLELGWWSIPISSAILACFYIGIFTQIKHRLG